MIWNQLAREFESKDYLIYNKSLNHKMFIILSAAYSIICGITIVYTILKMFQLMIGDRLYTTENKHICSGIQLENRERVYGRL